MKKILITGVNSFVGNSFADWVKNSPEKYYVDKISVRDDSWKKRDFSSYDVILHVAGIAHVSRNPKLEDLYYRVNRDLTIELAKKAKRDGVSQFVFLSSIIVYGDSMNNTGYITKDTVPKPSNFYGRSKLEAEEGLRKLEDKEFKIVIIRPPMIYGKGSKGNYPKLASFARKIPIFPEFINKRSMIHINNLCEFIKIMIDNNESGLFFPQNKELVNTTEMVKMIASVHNKKIKTTKIFNPFINLLVNRVTLINKVFGDLYYDINLSKYKVDYCIVDFKTSIELTESRDN